MSRNIWLTAVLTLCCTPVLMGADDCDSDPPARPEAGTPDGGTDAAPPTTCYVGGCSSQLCSSTPGLASTCEWQDEYACYRDATCEVQADGQCGWTETPKLTSCLGGNPEPMPGPCFVGGCSGQICSDAPGAPSTCEFRPEYACYRDAACERQSDGMCGWTETPELLACLTPNPPPTPGPAPCYVGGCSGQLCTDTPGAASTCEWLEEYACYRSASCERQADGACGWTESPALQMCIDSARGS
ncbi:MAG: hypothetical protein AAGF12_22350 [Myxococcota bacterium]